MDKNLDLTKMEFLLTLNDNFVVQRYYNVKNYNEKAYKSVEFYELLKSISDVIQSDLKMKSTIYMMDNFEQIYLDPTVLDTSNTDEDESFNIYIKVGDKTICHRVFDAKMYPPKVRYTVDVRPHLKNILKCLTDIFSDEDLSFEYMDYTLN
jgi:hypothetical protein